MIKHILLLIFFLGLSFAHAQSLKRPASEVQTLLFITEAFGSSATMINPAGLARNPYDDGLYANYNFSQAQKSEEYNYGFSLGNLGFGYQNFLLNDSGTRPALTYYRLGMALGGKVLSLGTSSKIIALDMEGFSERVFSIDAGFIFQPVKFITLAGFGRDLDEPTIGEFTFKREYTAGLSINLPDNMVRLLVEGT